jgi:UDP-N-acetylglucosamine acyltransferase
MIHSSTIIEEGAVIADDVTIGPFCYIGKNVHLSRGCKLESNIVLAGKLFIDEDVRIFSFSTIGHESSDIENGLCPNILWC